MLATEQAKFQSMLGTAQAVPNITYPGIPDSNVTAKFAAQYTAELKKRAKMLSQHSGAVDSIVTGAYNVTYNAASKAEYAKRQAMAKSHKAAVDAIIAGDYNITFTDAAKAEFAKRQKDLAKHKVAVAARVRLTCNAQHAHMRHITLAQTACRP